MVTTEAPAQAEFASHGYALVPRLIDRSLADFLWSYAHTRFACRMLNSGTRQVPNTPSAYADPAFEGLLEYLRPEIERRTALSLHPTYSYFRIYKSGDTLEKHHDRPACEVSVTLNIGQTPEEPWPIHVQGAQGPFTARLRPGDALLYRGLELPHWRDRFEGSRMVQAFLHYVDRNGPHADQKFDKRATLMLPPPGRSRDNAEDSP